MSNRIRGHLRSNIVGYIALFCFAMTGTAMALDGSNTVFTDDIVNGEVKNPDIAPNSVHTNQIQNNAVREADIQTGAVHGDEIADDSLGGSDINEADLATNNVSNGTDAVACTADVHVEITCATTTLTLPYDGAIVANATGTWNSFHLDDDSGDESGTDDPTRVLGRCVLKLDGTQISPYGFMGEDENAGNGSEHHPGDAPGTMAVIGRGSASAGAHTVALVCREIDGDIDFDNIGLTAQGTD